MKLRLEDFPAVVSKIMYYIQQFFWLCYNVAMNDKQIRILKDEVERKFLPFVRRPGRYIGGEINQVKKDLSGCDITVALCFPDIYEIGASHTGLAVIYHILNQLEGVAAERVYAPWIDAEEVLQREDIGLFSLESKAAVGDFDVMAFSLTSELACTNVLNMLDLAGLEVRADKRGLDHPLVIAGGQMPNCAEPIAEFVDLFVLGDGEEAVVELIELIKEQKAGGADKFEILLKSAQSLSYAYVPSLYEFEYEGEKIKSFSGKVEGLPTRFENAVVLDLNNALVPEKPIVPFVKAVHERVSVEIMRGCPGRCRFCQASFCKRPIRYRSIEKIIDIAKKSYISTGFDTVSLLSLSTADYPDIEKLVVELAEFFEPRHVGISLPSLRVQQQLKLLPKMTVTVRKSGLTIAVEAADERLRMIINKPISNEDLFAGIEAAYEAGFQKVKLYFMVGLPGENEDDIIQIVDLSRKIALLGKKTANINVAVSWFVPKPHTPFEWFGQKDIEYFEEAKRLILTRKRELKAKYLRFKFHDIESSVLESALARGDRRMAGVIETAWRLGAKFDLWSECFDFGIWVEAFEKQGLKISDFAQKSYEINEILPWQHLGGPSKKHLLKHFNDVILEC